MRIGVLGGSFDPPHLCHIALGHAAIKSLELDEVIFIPAARNPLKSHMPGASARDRLEMVRLAIEDEPKFALSDQEVRRGGKSYMIETLDELHSIRSADYWLILGADSAGQLPSWKGYPRILRLARLAVAMRPSEQGVSLPELVANATDWIDMAPCTISSTDIRLRIQEKKPFDSLLPAKVARYIRQNSLYGL